MNTVKRILLSGVFFVVATASGLASTNLLPGVLYCDPPVKLQGGFVFLYSTDGYWTPKASIYEFDLGNKLLQLVTESPGGDFDVAEDGQTFCVRYGVVNGFGLFITNAFIYSKRFNQGRVQTFEKRPSHVTFAKDHVFFHFDQRVFDYDIAQGAMKRVTLPSERAGESGADNSSIAMPNDFHPFGIRSVDARWVFFEGGDGALRGTRLVSSPLNESDTHYNDPKGKNVRMLKRFSKPLTGSFNLDQMSPCGRFALIRRSSPIGDGWGNTYYAVNIENGDTQVLLKEMVCSIGKARISYVHWVGGILATH